MPLDNAKFELARETVELPRPKVPAKATHRERARLVIGPVIAAHAGQSRKKIRRALQAVYSYYADRKSGRVYKVWCEECAFALRERPRKHPGRHGVIPTEAVMPSMRGHVARSGRLEATAVLDVDFEQGPVPDARTPEEIAAEFRELDRIAPTAADKFALMFAGGGEVIDGQKQLPF